MPSIADATRLFRFRRGAREFIVVGACGHVGVLSGMLPGAYSVTVGMPVASDICLSVTSAEVVERLPMIR